jgi:hypothetical protein
MAATCRDDHPRARKTGEGGTMLLKNVHLTIGANGQPSGKKESRHV